MITKSACLLLLSSILLCGATHASQTGDTQTIQFKGEFILMPPCSVNNEQVIAISFGNIGINKVDGINFKKPVPYTVKCFGSQDDTPVNLKISGHAEGFDPAAIATSADGLGIQVQMNGQAMPLNIPVVTTLSAVASLQLSVVPVKDPGKKLTGQAFTAAATLTADYE